MEALKKSLKPKATLKRDGVWNEISATLIDPGDLGPWTLCCSPIPADCRVNKGQIDVDQAALTGESLRVSFATGEILQNGIYCGEGRDGRNS